MIRAYSVSALCVSQRFPQIFQSLIFLYCACEYKIFWFVSFHHLKKRQTSIDHCPPRMIASSIVKPFAALWTHLNEKQNTLQKLAMQKELQEDEIKSKQADLDKSTLCHQTFIYTPELYQAWIEY